MDCALLFGVLMKRTTFEKTRNRKYWKKFENFLIKKYHSKTRQQVRNHLLTLKFTLPIKSTFYN